MTPFGPKQATPFGPKQATPFGPKQATPFGPKQATPASQKESVSGLGRPDSSLVKREPGMLRLISLAPILKRASL